MDKQQAQNIIRETFENSFDKNRFIGFIKNLLNHIDEAPFIYQGNYIPEKFRQYIKSLERIGKFSDGDHTLDILIITLQKETSLERARTMQRNFIAWYLNGSRGGQLKDAALVAYVSPDQADWRFSLVKMDYKFEKTESGRVKVKEELTPARRWSFLVGAHEKSHTAQSRLIKILANDDHAPTLKELETAFDIETVTKEFFIKYRELFIRTKEALDNVVAKDPKVKADFDAKGVDTVNFAKKLLGQIVFLYFLQKKGWFGVGRDDNWGTGSREFLRHLFVKRHGDYQNFFNDILEPLFYEALRIDRSHDDDYYSHFNCKIPFLNGGLFDPIGNYNWEHTDIHLPNDLFSNTRKTKEGDVGDGILDVFDRYNFTVREDEPLEKEVAIDPELLGKAYEKFNAIRPDNFAEFIKAMKSGKKGEENKFNKKFGVYYTPREIVHYMCKQSLINYMYTQAENKELSSEIQKQDIEDLIEVGELITEHEATALIKEENIKSGVQKSTEYTALLSEGIRENATEIDRWLENITVCDPAVGSGAFPVGMMNEIVRARNVLSVYLDNGDRNDYEFKRRCIEHSLYGVDIDPGAVEIAKLRLWLSLVVDEEDIKNIKPLPNLDYKIVCGNSLLGVEKTLFNNQLFEKLERLKPLYFNETNPTKKQAYKKQIDDLISQITKGHTEFDFEVYFSEVFHAKGGFDVVIANPPYVRMENFKGLKNTLKKEYKAFHPRADLYCYFLELAYNISRPGGISTYISSNKYFRSGYGKPLRGLLSQKATIKTIINFSGTRVFDTAAVDTAIIIFQKPAKEDSKFIFVEISSPIENDQFERYVLEQVVAFNQRELIENGWVFTAAEISPIISKMNLSGTPLKHYGLRVVRGIVSGAKDVFEVNENKRQAFLKDNGAHELIKPIVHGKEIHRWQFTKPKKYILFIKRGVDIKKYPQIYEHLEKNKKVLSKRATVGTHPWYELQQPQMGIYEEFEKVRIIYPDISEKPRFALSPAGIYCDNTTYNLTTDSKYILAVLNSRLVDVFYKSIANALGNRAVRYFSQYVEQIPVPVADSKKQKPLIDLVDQILAITKDDDYLENPAKQAKVREYERQIDQLVYELYGLTEDEIKIVEETIK